MEYDWRSNLAKLKFKNTFHKKLNLFIGKNFKTYFLFKIMNINYLRHKSLKFMAIFKANLFSCLGINFYQLISESQLHVHEIFLMHHLNSLTQFCISKHHHSMALVISFFHSKNLTIRQTEIFYHSIGLQLCLLLIRFKS